MDHKKNEVRKDSKGKEVPKLLKEKHATKSSSPSKHKIRAHSGLYFHIRKPAKLQKNADLTTESNKLEEVDTNRCFTNSDEPRRAKIEEESILKPTGNFEMSLAPSAVELCNTKSHSDESIVAKSNILHQCQGSCKCSNFIELLDTVCTSQRQTKSEFPEVRKDSKASLSIVSAKSVRTRQKANDIEKEKNSRHPICSELKHQSRIISKLRPPSSRKSACISGTQSMDATPKSTTVSKPQPRSAPATRVKYVDTRLRSGSTSVTVSETVSVFVSETTSVAASEPESVAASEPESVAASEPESVTASEPAIVAASEPAIVAASEPAIVAASEPAIVTVSNPLSSPEPTLKGSKVDKLPYPLDPSDKYVFMSYSSTVSDIRDGTEPSDRPAFWPPSGPTYEIIYKVESSSEPTSNPLSPLKSKPLGVQKSQPSGATKTESSCSQKAQLSKLTKMPPTCAASSRTSLIPIKIRQNVDEKDTKPSGRKDMPLSGRNPTELPKLADFTTESNKPEEVCI